MGETPWYETFFNEDYVRLYAPFLPPARTEQDVEAIIKLLNLQPADRVLDLCCGYGRHALALAHYGCQVTGQDLSPALLEKARASATEQKVEVQWLQSDMRTIPFEEEFDAIISMFTSFGYFSSDEDDQKVLQQIAKALKPGGYFLLETIHQPRVMRTTAPHSIIRYPDDLIVLEERHVDLLTSRNEVRISLIHPDGRRNEHRQSIRAYTLTELIKMLNAAGLEMTAYYGGLDGSPLSIESRLVLISQKQ
ncbi:class I SAM-dependent methyltransferase [Dictyobacter kobayashii]|uniref:Methyltransferase type 11 n=1 Tax=Dictyobacter kobayashii TaxID=2014872 RepID=A0A402APB0_9CHLR|nr:class I SAM-dependent methyltransferase [Dictyobacter kobayashii]GCE21003.1 methyltransferase type 11 [Dictyobacter kobayashii]